MYRVHETDAIRFEQRLKFAFVNPWSPDRLRPFCFSSVAFLYLDKPEGHGSPIPPAKDLLCWYRIRDTDHQSIPSPAWVLRRALPYIGPCMCIR